MRAITYAAEAVLALTLCVRVAHASGPIAVYALVEKVAFEPSAEKPERIRISGVFITAEERTDKYSEPQRGYLYLTLPRNDEALARREWADLKSIAGTRQVVGIGSSWFGAVHVKKMAEQGGSPEVYPMGNGLIRINSDQPRAKALLEYKDR